MDIMTILGVVISLKTRKDGLLSLESELSGAELDPFIKKGFKWLSMEVDILILNTNLNNSETSK